MTPPTARRQRQRHLGKRSASFWASQIARESASALAAVTAARYEVIHDAARGRLRRGLGLPTRGRRPPSGEYAGDQREIGIDCTSIIVVTCLGGAPIFRTEHTVTGDEVRALLARGVGSLRR